MNFSRVITKNKILKKLIIFVIIMVFLCHDISWAFPVEDSSNHQELLQAELIFSPILDHAKEAPEAKFRISAELWTIFKHALKKVPFQETNALLSGWYGVSFSKEKNKLVRLVDDLPVPNPRIEEEGTIIVVEILDRQDGKWRRYEITLAARTIYELVDDPKKIQIRHIPKTSKDEPKSEDHKRKDNIRIGNRAKPDISTLQFTGDNKNLATVQVYDSLSNCPLPLLTLIKQKDVNPIEKTLLFMDKSLPSVGIESLTIIRGILNTLNNISRPEFYIFEQKIMDLLGFVSVKHKLISISNEIATHPIALLHELLEYAIDLKIVEIKLLDRGTLRIDFSEEYKTYNENAHPRDTNYINIDVRSTLRDLLEAGEEWASWDIEALNSHPHYLIRILQRNAAGSHDYIFTELIQRTNSSSRINYIPRLSSLDEDISAARLLLKDSGIDYVLRGNDGRHYASVRYIKRDGGSVSATVPLENIFWNSRLAINMAIFKIAIELRDRMYIKISENSISEHQKKYLRMCLEICDMGLLAEAVKRGEISYETLRSILEDEADDQEIKKLNISLRKVYERYKIRFIRAKEFYKRFNLDLELVPFYRTGKPAYKFLGGERMTGVTIGLSVFEVMMPYLEEFEDLVPKAKLTEALYECSESYSKSLFLLRYLITLKEHNLLRYMDSSYYSQNKFIPRLVFAKQWELEDSLAQAEEWYRMGAPLDRIRKRSEREKRQIITDHIMEFLRLTNDVMFMSIFRSQQDMYTYIEDNPRAVITTFFSLMNSAWNDLQDKEWDLFESKDASLINNMHKQTGISINNIHQIINTFADDTITGIQILRLIAGLFDPLAEEGAVLEKNARSEELVMHIINTLRGDIKTSLIFKRLREYKKHGVFKFEEIESLILNLQGKTSLVVFNALDLEFFRFLNNDEALVTHWLKFLSNLAKKSGNAAGLVIEGVIEAAYKGIISIRPEGEEQEYIVNFCEEMNYFSPELYKAYKDAKFRDIFLKRLKTVRKKILEDIFEMEDMAAITELVEWDTEFEKNRFLLAVFLMAIPPRDTSFLNTQDAVDLIRESRIAGGLGSHIPKNFKRFNRTISIASTDKKRVDKRINHSEHLTKLIEEYEKIRRQHENVTEEELEEKLLLYATEAAFKDDLKAIAVKFLMQYEETQMRLRGILKETNYYSQLSSLQELHKFLEQKLEELIKSLKQKRSAGGNSMIKVESVVGWLKKLASIPDDKIERFLNGISGEHLLIVQDTLSGIIKEESELSKALGKALDIGELRSIFNDDKRRLINQAIDRVISSRERSKAYEALSRVDFVQEVWGEDNKILKEEIDNFHDVEMAKKRLTFRIAKGVPYITYGLNCGTCTAKRVELWKDPSFYPVAIIDEANETVEGFVQLYDYVDKKTGKRILQIVGIDPTIRLLSEVDPFELFDEIISLVQQMGRVGNYDHVYLPVDKHINSNRPKIREIIDEMGLEAITLPEPINWTTDHPIHQVFDVKKIITREKRRILYENLARLNHRASSEMLNRIIESAVNAAKTLSLEQSMRPVDFIIDLSLIPEESLDENAALIALLLSTYQSLGISNVNIVFKRSFAANGLELTKSLRDRINRSVSEGAIKEAIKAKLGKLGVFSKIKSASDNNAIQIPIISKEWLQCMRTQGMGLEPNQYPVALDDSIIIKGDGTPLRNFEAAFTIGLAEAALLMAKERDAQKQANEEKEVPELRVRLHKTLSQLYSILVPRLSIGEDTLNYMVDPDSNVRLELAISLALPSITKAMISEIRDLHEITERYLKFA